MQAFTMSKLEVVDLIESWAGAKVSFLPPYSPDLMPAEGAWVK